MGQGLLDHAKKATMAMNLSALALPLEELVAYASKLEELEEEGADPNEPRQQIYPAAFASQVLMFTVRRLGHSKQMSPQTAADIFGPGPSASAGPGLFLASSPRLRDIGGGPNMAEVERCLSEGFVCFYILDLMARSCEPELRQASSTLLTVIDGWARHLNQSQSEWLNDLTDVANGLLCVSDNRFTLPRMEALARVQAATRGAARKVNEALQKKPWQNKVVHAWSIGMSEITLRPKLDGLVASLPGRPDAWEEAAEALPELRASMQRGATDGLESLMWRVLSDQYASFESQGAEADVALDVSQAQAMLGRLRVGRELTSTDKPSTGSLDAMEAALSARVTNADIAGRRTVLFQAAAKLELDHEAGPEEAEGLRSTIGAVHSAAVGCRGMRLGADELGPAFGRLLEYVEATAAVGSLEVGADVVLSAVECALAVADVMAPEEPMAEVPPVMGAAILRLSQLAATLQVTAAADEFSKLGLDFEARLVADSHRVLFSVLDALARLDAIPCADGDPELPAVDEARAIALSYWEQAEQKALVELAAAQAKLVKLNEPSWKYELVDKVSWDDLVATGGEFLTSFDSGKMLDSTRPLKKARPAERKQKPQLPKLELTFTHLQLDLDTAFVARRP